MQRYIFLLFVVNLCWFVKCLGQTKSYTKLNYKRCNFRVFDITLTSNSAKRFKLISNSSNLPHYDFLRAEALNSYSKYFWISTTSCDDKNFPIGYYVVDGNVIKPVNNSTSGNGNFFMQPNGALVISGNSIDIFETNEIPTISTPQIAFQSGPMLVTNSIINNSFQEKSSNVNIRSGVGIYLDTKTNKKHLVFVVSSHPVNFFVIASLFKDKFKCKQALALNSANCAMSLPNEGTELMININKTSFSYLRY